MKGVSIHIICVGKLKEKFYIDGAAEYVKRLGGYCRLTLTELPEERLPKSPSRAQIDAALEKEAAAVRAKLPPNSSLVALCVEGKLCSSEELAKLVSDWSLSSAKHLVSHRQLLRPPPLSEGPGLGEAVHVSHDLPPPPGPGHAAGAALSGFQD